MISPEPDLKSARKIADEIRLTLNQQPVWVQGAVLAELTGNFLASFVVKGDYGATAMMRFAVLQALIEVAQDLANAAEKHSVAGHA